MDILSFFSLIFYYVIYSIGGLLFLSLPIVVPALIYLIVRRIFKAWGRILRILITLVLSLAFASCLPFLISLLPLVGNFYCLSPVLPWSQCGGGWGGSMICSDIPDPNCPDCIGGHIGLIVCKVVQLYEWALMIAAIVFILASLVYDLIKKKKK